MMFQNFFDGIGAVCFGSLMLTTNMNKANVEDGFAHLQESSRQPVCRSASRSQKSHAGTPAAHHA